MNARLKALGLALATAVALGALAASTASAHEFHSDGEVTHLTSHAEGFQALFFTPEDEIFIGCEETTVTGTITGTEVEPETYKSDAVTVEPHYTKCGIYKAGTKEKIIGATVDATGCHFTFHSDTDVNEHATVDINETAETRCEGAGIIFTVLGQACIHIPAQNGLTGVHYETVETENGIEDITVKATINNIKSETTHHPLVGCATETGESETHEGGTYDGEVSVTGFKDAEHTEPTSITLGPDE